jgi:hypothetical protein
MKVVAIALCSCYLTRTTRKVVQNQGTFTHVVDDDDPDAHVDHHK